MAFLNTPDVRVHQLCQDLSYVFLTWLDRMIVLTEQVHCQKYIKTGSLYVPFLNYNFSNVSL